MGLEQLTSSSGYSELWTSLAKLLDFLLGVGGDFLVLFLLIVPLFDVVVPFLTQTDFGNPPRFIALVSTVLFYEVLVERDSPLKFSAKFAVLHDFFLHSINRVFFILSRRQFTLVLSSNRGYIP